MKQIKINGLLWDVENLEIDGKTHFTFDEAQEAAKSVGKRLPTLEEYEALTSLWSRWDEDRKGRWFRDEDGNEVFFPAAGIRNNRSPGVYYVDTNGYYWQATGYGTSSQLAFALYFTSSGVSPTYANDRSYGFSVRCVQDIE